MTRPATPAALAALRAAVLAAPAADLPRVAYADALEGGGDPAGRAHAALIRGQLARPTAAVVYTLFADHAHPGRVPAGGWRHPRTWEGFWPLTRHAASQAGAEAAAAPVRELAAAGATRFAVRRGFVAEVDLTPDRFGPAGSHRADPARLLARHPLELVRFIGVEPALFGDGVGRPPLHGWYAARDWPPDWANHTAQVPEALWAHLGGGEVRGGWRLYRHPVVAAVALARAAAAWFAARRPPPEPAGW